MELKYCPRCRFKDVDRILTTQRRNIFRCTNCNWRSKPFIPPIKPIPTTKKVRVYQFGGWGFEVYDVYGQCVIYSRSYGTKEEAIENMQKTLKNGKGKPYGPYTGIIWPQTIEVKAEVFK